MEAELIEAVRGNICLYDVKHPNYVKTALKDYIWQQIARDLKLKDGKEAKRTWEKLRCNHRDALRRQRKMAPENIRPWRYQESMEFLVPFMGIRTSQSHRKSDNGNPEMKNDHEESQNEETNQSKPTSVIDQTNRKRRRLNRSFEEHDGEGKILHSRNDPLYHFFISMYETTRRLPPLSRHNVKTQIFNLVSQEELQILEQCCSSRPNSSHTQNYDSDGGTRDSVLSPVQQENDGIIIKEEGPDNVSHFSHSFN